MPPKSVFLNYEAVAIDPIRGGGDGGGTCGGACEASCPRDKPCSQGGGIDCSDMEICCTNGKSVGPIPEPEIKAFNS